MIDTEMNDRLTLKIMIVLASIVIVGVGVIVVVACYALAALGAYA